MYRSLHNPYNTELTCIFVSGYIRNSHCTKINFHIWKSILNLLQRLCKVPFSVHLEHFSKGRNGKCFDYTMSVVVSLSACNVNSK